ncbi:MAG: hypothetical protein ACOX52_18515 [Verrucomicrobiota bacterium]
MSKSKSVSESIPILYGAWPSEHRSNLAAESCQHRNRTVALPGFSCPNPNPRPYHTEADSEPDLASPSTFSDSLLLTRRNQYPAPYSTAVSYPPGW